MSKRRKHSKWNYNTKKSTSAKQNITGEDVGAILLLVIVLLTVICFFHFFYSVFQGEFLDALISFVFFAVGLFIIICSNNASQQKDTYWKSIQGHPISQMSGDNFEHYCAYWLSQRGFHGIIVTPASNDYGADIIAFDSQKRKWVFQCKRYSGMVGNSSVQEVVSAKAHYNATYSAVITNSRLTDNARTLARENQVVLFENIN